MSNPKNSPPSGAPKDYEPSFPQVIDNVMRSSFVSCPHSFYEEHILKRSATGGSVHLVAGAAYAKGLEIVRRLIWGEGMELEDALCEAFPHIIAEYGTFPCPERYHYKSWERVIQGVVAYFDKWPPKEDNLVPYISPNTGKPAIEFTFSFPTQIPHPETGQPILFAGRFDMIGVYNDTLWVVDDKTASQLGPNWDKQWRLKAQLTGYTFAARQYGIPVEGALVSGISFLPSGAYGFSRPIEYRPDFILERWWVQLHRDIARMVQCWLDRDEENPYGYWDYDLNDACTAYGGCPFQQLCSAKDENQWAKTGFEYRDWNPLDLNPGRVEVPVPDVVVIES